MACSSRRIVFAAAALVLVWLAAASDSKHHHHRRHHPLSMDVAEIDDQQQQLQVAPATVTTAMTATSKLSDSGPLTRADFNGEAPYEERELEEEEDSSTSTNSEIYEKGFEMKPVQADEDDDVRVLNQPMDLENTLPRLLPDGRLVRVPKVISGNATLANGQSQSAAPAARNVPAPKMTSKQQQQQQQQYAASRPAQATRPAAPPHTGSPVRVEELEALQLGEGTGATTQAKAKQDPPYPGPKVRVSSLVSGILSSVLSSVLTRGLNFASAKEQTRSM